MILYINFDILLLLLRASEPSICNLEANFFAFIYTYLYEFNLEFFMSLFNPFILAIAPVVVYSNADLDKLSILKESKNKSGIYLWRNLIDDKFYIGSSVNLNVRFLQYYNVGHLAKFQKSSYIYRALLKYGYSQFSLEILEYCDRKDTIKREQHYIDLLKPKYNLSPTAGSNLGYKHTEQTKAAVSAASLGKARPEGSGRPSQRIEVFNLLTSERTEYDSISAAALALNIKKAIISTYIRNNQKKPLKKIYVIKKIDIV